MTDVNLAVTAGVGADTWVDIDNPNVNFGIFDKIYLKGTYQKGLFRFDFSGIPAGATCDSAVLKLYALNAELSVTYNLYEISDANGDWVEGTKNAATAGTGEPCWNKKKYNTVDWAGSVGLGTAGTDYVNTILATVTTASAGAGSEIFLTFNAAGLAKLASWFGGATNNGFVLITANANTTREMASGEHATVGYRPVLSISYTETATDDLVAADFTLASVTFDTPTLVNVAGTANLVAVDFTLSAPTFDAPTIVNVWATPACRTYSIESESRVLAIEAESRVMTIQPEMRGVKITCESESKYEITRLTYNGLTAVDLTLNAPTFDAPGLLTDIVPEPAAELAFVPFYVKDDGDGTFSTFSKTAPHAAFDLRAHAGVTVNKTYYVATTGNDTTGDGSSGNPFKTISKAIGMADVDRVYIAAGHYSTNLINPARNIEIIGVGDVYLSDNLNGFVGTFSKVDNHYEASYGFAAAPKVVDLSTTDATGNPLIYTLKTSGAEVDAAAGSYYCDVAGDVIYVRTFDDRAPDANLLYLYIRQIFRPQAAGITVYLENLKLYNGILHNSVGGKLFAKDCAMDVFYLTTFGFELTNSTEVILQNTTITRASDDGVRLNAGNVALIDCNINYCGGGSESNCLSCHSGNAVLVNGEYSHTTGRPLHDVSTGKSWYLGAYAHHGAYPTYSNFYASQQSGTDHETWCDQCRSSDSGYDYGAILPSAMHKHNCTGDATDLGNGVDTYDY